MKYLTILILLLISCSLSFSQERTSSNFKDWQFLHGDFAHIRLGISQSDPNSIVRQEINLLRDFNGDWRVHGGISFRLYRKGSGPQLWVYPYPFNYNINETGFNNPLLKTQIQIINTKYFKAGFETWHYIKSWTLTFYISGGYFSKWKPTKLDGA